MGERKVWLVSDTVLIIAQEDDLHAKVVANELRTELGARAIILDSANYPNQWCLSFTIGAQQVSDFRLQIGDESVHGARVAGVWWRRPRAHRIAISVADREVRSFCANEAQAAFDGWIYSLGDAVINPLISERAASRKPLQLQYAALAGFTVPKTLISNCENDVRSFFAENNEKIVFKILTSVNWQFAETRRLQSDQLARLNSLIHAPAIFQEEITEKTDVRVTVVDEKVFAVTINPRHPGAQLDWRLDMGAEIKTHVLPAAIVDKILRLQCSLGLRYSAIDLGLTPSGEYVFFEVNTGGQFLFAEIHGEQPITAALAYALVTGKSTADKRTPIPA